MGKDIFPRLEIDTNFLKKSTDLKKIQARFSSAETPLCIWALKHLPYFLYMPDEGELMLRCGGNNRSVKLIVIKNGEGEESIVGKIILSKQ